MGIGVIFEEAGAGFGEGGVFLLSEAQHFHALLALDELDEFKGFFGVFGSARNDEDIEIENS